MDLKKFAIDLRKQLFPTNPEFITKDELIQSVHIPTIKYTKGAERPYIEDGSLIAQNDEYTVFDLAYALSFELVKEEYNRLGLTITKQVSYDAEIFATGLILSESYLFDTIRDNILTDGEHEYINLKSVAERYQIPERILNVYLTQSKIITNIFENKDQRCLLI